MPRQRLVSIALPAALFVALAGCQTTPESEEEDTAFAADAPTSSASESAAGDDDANAASADGTVTGVVDSPMGRGGWEVMTFRPADGRTTHTPTYTDLDDPRADDINAVVTGPVPSRMVAALGGQEANNWGAANTKTMATAPLGYAWDLLTMPVDMVQTPPWTMVTTPETE